MLCISICHHGSQIQVLRKPLYDKALFGSEAIDIVFIMHNFCFYLFASKAAQSHILATGESQTSITAIVKASQPV